MRGSRKKFAALFHFALCIFLIFFSACGEETPSAPTNVTATAGDGRVRITWDSVSGATSYNIYWATFAGVSKSKSVGYCYHCGKMKGRKTFVLWYKSILFPPEKHNGAKVNHSINPPLSFF